MRRLRAEMHRRMLGNGYCARPVGLDCHFESISESCTLFQTTIEFRPTRRRSRQVTTRCRSGGRTRSSPRGGVPTRVRCAGIRWPSFTRPRTGVVLPARAAWSAGAQPLLQLWRLPSLVANLPEGDVSAPWYAPNKMSGDVKKRYFELIRRAISARQLDQLGHRPLFG